MTPKTMRPPAPSDAQAADGTVLWTPHFSTLHEGFANWQQIMDDLAAGGYNGWIAFEDFPQADMDLARDVDKRASRVKIANRFSRLALACVTGDQPMRHPCFQQPDTILEKLRKFHHVHQTSLDRVLADLETAVEQLPYNTCGREAAVVSKVLEERTQRRRGAVAISELLPAVLARLNIRTTEYENRDRS